MGYTPAFDDIYMGTLYGRWPAAAVWASLLPLMDRLGRIDMSMQAISGMTGWPMDLLEAGIKQLMEPDQNSRSPGAEGRRLVALDSGRPWGWVAVNHGKYREKARKQSYDSDRTESGRDAERKKASRDVPTRPDASRSQTETKTKTQTEEKRGEARARALPSTRLPDDFALTPERRLVAEAERLPADRTFSKFCDYWRAVSGAKARKHDWDATWRNWCRNEVDRGKPNGSAERKPTRHEQIFGREEVEIVDDPQG